MLGFARLTIWLICPPPVQIIVQELNCWISYWPVGNATVQLILARRIFSSSIHFELQGVKQLFIFYLSLLFAKHTHTHTVAIAQSLRLGDIADPSWIPHPSRCAEQEESRAKNSHQNSVLTACFAKSWLDFQLNPTCVRTGLGFSLLVVVAFIALRAPKCLSLLQTWSAILFGCAFYPNPQHSLPRFLLSWDLQIARNRNMGVSGQQESFSKQ